MKRQKKQIVDSSIINVLRYYDFFDYCPDLSLIHTFLSVKTSKKALKTAISKLERHNCSEYTPVEYSTYERFAISAPSSRSFRTMSFKVKNLSKRNNLAIQQFSNLSKRQEISKSKLNSFRFKLYIKLLSLFPQIKLVGLSGSISMMNAKEDDDIDLFIITAKDRLFTGRFIALIFSLILSLKRKRVVTGNRSNATNYRLQATGVKDKVCLNLFFDEGNLKVPKFKQTLFVGHEVLQMKPIINKDFTYEKFLKANSWVSKLFPNAKSKVQSLNVKSNPKSKVQIFGFKILNFICHLDFVIWIYNKIESLLKNFQLKLINKHKTTEIITDSQLWFHPDDFEKKIFKSPLCSRYQDPKLPSGP